MKKILLIFYLVIFSVLFPMLLLSISVKAQGTSDVEFEFENETLFNENRPLNYTTFNMRNQTTITGYFDATFSFQNEVGLTGTNIGFINDTTGSGGGVSYSVIDDSMGHREVLYIQDTILGDTFNFRNEFSSSRTTGIIEFYAKAEDVSGALVFFLEDSIGTDAFKLYIYQDLIRVHDGGYQAVTTCVDNMWYHILILFDTTTDDANIWVNGYNYGSYNFANAVTEIDTLYIWGGSGFTDSKFLDGIGYSWEGYDYWTNLYPETLVNDTIIEVDKFEYGFDDENSLYPINYDNPSTWTDIEDGGGDVVNVIADTIQDRKVMIFEDTTSGKNGLEKSFSINYGFFNISLELPLVRLDNDMGHFNCSVYSTDSSLILQYCIRNDAGTRKVYYFDGVNDVYLYTVSSNLDSEYSINIYIQDTHAIIRFFNSFNNNSEVSQIPLAEDKSGISKIELYAYMNDLSDSCIVYIDSCGVYVNGTSYAKDYYLYNYEMYSTVLPQYREWWTDELNLMYINASGSFSLGVYDFGTNDIVNGWATYTGLDVFNLILEGWYYVNPILRIASNETVIVNSIRVVGVKLVEGLNEYWMRYRYGNVDIDNCFFWGVGNRLMYSLTHNDGGLEYIVAGFDVGNVLSENRSYSFTSDVNGGGVGLTRINYTDYTYTPFIAPYYATTTNELLPQSKEITAIVILITDDNLLDSGATTGYFANFKFLYVGGVSFTLTTVSLMTALIPLMIILIPTLTVHAFLKKDIKDAFLYMFLIMSVLCAVVSILPFWLLIIIVFGFGISAMEKKEEGI